MPEEAFVGLLEPASPVQSPADLVKIAIEKANAMIARQRVELPAEQMLPPPPPVPVGKMMGYVEPPGPPSPAMPPMEHVSKKARVSGPPPKAPRVVMAASPLDVPASPSLGFRV
ncbi:unnamed protein product [Symbiodinium natans]|uniref:Uncharacterized protein n=1 Tax=Symbiodinium natans TaxID=878477 RepID=A0A812NZX7_9DINO|nr:unnamed protein product [Symbiodinium natans]